MAKQDPRWTKFKPSKMLLFFLLLMIVKSNDIQTNPGPSRDSTKYLCGTCDQSVNWDHKGIVCETCDQCTKPDIIFGTETWLNPKIKDVEIFPDNFKLYRNDRKKTETDKEGDGVLIAIKKELTSSEVYKLAPPDKTEMVWAKVDIVGSKTLYFSSFYNQKTSDETSLKNFDLMIRKATQIKNSTLIKGGDFNLPGWDLNNRSLKPNTNYPHLHNFFGNSLDDTCLTKIVDVPTRKDNILDLIITNLPNQTPVLLPDITIPLNHVQHGYKEMMIHTGHTLLVDRGEALKIFRSFKPSVRHRPDLRSFGEFDISRIRFVVQ
ncbi:unnamed protein product [Mytilus coruscus]|uniref:Endonuclease/exonuclease/phosphatase domain-containing protein n=1 Tax=Mytilus coruscus TaxID=42192 RepID=A0A6J8DJS7_MYTCO|nr:unnamed protein product [Mytilus coruscus]